MSPAHVRVGARNDRIRLDICLRLRYFLHGLQPSAGPGARAAKAERAARVERRGTWHGKWALLAPTPQEGSPGQGRMKSHRGPTTSAALAALALAIAAPPAVGNTLLSGYGGPGQGNQAILGAALINPPRGGGGSSSAPRAQTGTPAGALASSGSSPAAQAPAASNRAARSGGGRTPSPARGGNASAGGGRANGSLPGTPTPEAAVGSSTLGLSGADLLYILLVLGALAGMGVLTRRLASRPG